MWYEYRCGECGQIHESQIFARIGQLHPFDVCCNDRELTRIVSSNVQTPKPQQPYYNHSVGEMVTSDKHYKQILARKSREHSERVGTTVNLQPVYPGDLKESTTQLGVGADGGESIEHARRTNPGSYKKSTTKVIY